jgi:proton-dependent oligopeptide transporter, POT family
MSTSQTFPIGSDPANGPASERTLFGHPTGLFTLFFAEMWERFSFYGMRALLSVYMVKGFLKFSDNQAYDIYGAYTSLVYATPFLGGILADRLLGPRRAVIIGGLLMACGQLLLGLQTEIAFFLALALLVCGNGFFKPNISGIVGDLYSRHDPKKDSGFTIFYMGINLGAGLAPMVCSYVGTEFGYSYGFMLAALGMSIGIAIFVAPTLLTQILIAVGSVATAIAMMIWQDSMPQLVARILLAIPLMISGAVAIIALGRGGLAKTAGAPRDPLAMRKWYGGVLRGDMALYLGILIALPVVYLLIRHYGIARGVLSLMGVVALAYILYDAFWRCGQIERHRIFVVLVLMFFSLVFWAFFEQAGSSMTLFTDRNVDRVFGSRQITEQEVGTTLTLRVQQNPIDKEYKSLPLLSQKQLGYKSIGTGRAFTITDLDKLQETARKRENWKKREAQVYDWPVRAEHVGMYIGDAEISAPEFQAVNPLFILVFGLLFSALWTVLSRRGLEPSTPVKFAVGLVLMGFGFAVLWYGATKMADGRGMVGMSWLVLGYLLHTTGELCLSPVGLSMVTRLSPTRIVSTMLGAWFLATAFSQSLASMIAKLTAVGTEEGGQNIIPPPIETVHVYGHVFGQIAIATMATAVLCFAVAPLLKRWEHPGEMVEEPASPAPPGGFPVQKVE